MKKVYTETKTPWWSYLMLITPVILIPVGIQMLNKVEEPPGEKRLIDDQPLEGIVKKHQEKELGDTELVISLFFIVVLTCLLYTSDAADE